MKLSRVALKGLQQALRQDVSRLPMGKMIDAAVRRHVAIIIAVEEVGGLSIDPFTINKLHWIPTHADVLRGCEAIQQLSASLLVLDLATERVRHSVLGYFQDIWFSMIAWMDFLHPGHGYIHGLDRAHIEAYFGFYIHLYRHKEDFSQEMSQTPQMHAWCMWLWLHVVETMQLSGSAQGVREDRRAPLEYRTLLAWSLQLNFAVKSMLSSSKEDAPLTIDMPRLREALASVQHRVHRLFSLAIRCASILLAGFSATERTSQGTRDLVLCLYDKLVLLHTFAEHTSQYIPDSLRPRGAAALLDIVRTVRDLPEGTSVASLGYEILSKYWYRSPDYRPLVRSLKDGIFPVMLTLDRTSLLEEDRVVHERLFWYIACRTAHYPVAAALQKYNGGLTFSHARFEDTKKWMEADEEVAKRFTIVREMSDLKCYNEVCLSGAHDKTHIRRCECYEVFYCSEACQRRHWPQHRAFCTARKKEQAFSAGEIVRDDISFVTPRDMYFIRRIIRNYLEDHGASVLQDLEDALQEESSTRQISLGVYFNDTIVPTTSVRCTDYFDLPEDALKDDVLIHVNVWMKAALNIDTTSAIIRLMLLKLSDLRLAVEHKRSMAALEVLCL